MSRLFFIPFCEYIKLVLPRAAQLEIWFFVRPLCFNLCPSWANSADHLYQHHLHSIDVFESGLFKDNITIKINAFSGGLPVLLGVLHPAAVRRLRDADALRRPGRRLRRRLRMPAVVRKMRLLLRSRLALIKNSPIPSLLYLHYETGTKKLGVERA